MDKKELRIGNLVMNNFKRENDIVEIDTIDFVEDWFKLFKPIPLTEEWLLKFGLPYFSETEYYSIRFSIKGFDFQSYDSINAFAYNFGFDDEIIIKYVHQLQNLYFVLTKKELTLNK